MTEYSNTIRILYTNIRMAFWNTLTTLVSLLVILLVYAYLTKRKEEPTGVDGRVHCPLVKLCNYLCDHLS